MKPPSATHFASAAVMAFVIAAQTYTLLGSDWSTGTTLLFRSMWVGDGNPITFTETLSAPMLSSSRFSSEGFFEFSFDAEVGRAYPVAVSSDLRHWSLLTNLSGAVGPIWIADKEASKYPQRFYQVGLPGTVVPGMVLIHPGTFTMGSPSHEPGRNSDEDPRTIVTLSRSFWMGKYEVTQGEYLAVMGINPSSFQGDLNRPVEQVSWYEATNYCAKLTEKDRSAGRIPAGYLYRLPTEAEWEYACRAGTTTAVGVGNGISLSSTQANFNGNYPYMAAGGPYLNQTAAIGSYAPNAWGLYDMHGNTWEWCQDWYGSYPGGSVTDPQGPATGSYRVLRGGSWYDFGYGCRSAYRRLKMPDYRNNLFGFRVVLAPGQ